MEVVENAATLEVDADIDADQDITNPDPTAHPRKFSLYT